MGLVSAAFQQIRVASAAFGFIVRTAAKSNLFTDPTISAGTGVPTLAEPNGSVWQRTDGTVGASFYQRVAGAWKALADAAQVAAILAENTDVIVPVDVIGSYNVVSGTWTASRQAAGAYRLRRTAAAAVENLAVRAFVRQRTSAAKGTKVLGAKIVYNVSTADINDVTVAGAFTVVPATGSSIAAATSLGASAYDGAHDTAAKRKAQGAHTMTVTFATPVYFNAETIAAELLFAVDGTAGGVFDLMAVELLCAETLVDAS